MNKKTYQRPTMCIMPFQSQTCILSSSGQSDYRPTATFMSNPDIGDEEE